MIAVGRVGRAHGLDGSFVVEDASADPERFAPNAHVYVGNVPATVIGSKRAGGRLVVKLDRPVRRGQLLTVPRHVLGEAEEGHHFVFELVGLEVVEEGGESLGRVKEVGAGVANDILELDSGLALPLVEECVVSIDLEAGRITVAPGFADWG